MFQYAKRDIKEKIVNYKAEWKKRKDIERNAQKQGKRFHDFLMLKKGFEGDSINSVLFLGCGILGGLLGFSGLVGGFLSVVFLASACLGFAFSIKNSISVLKKKKIMKEKYLDLLSLTDEELLEKQETFSRDGFKAHHEGLSFRNQIRRLEIEYEDISRYEAILNHSEIYHTPYYLADDENEYQTMEEQYNLLNSTMSFDEYLKECVDVFNVDLTSSIEAHPPLVKKL